MTEPTTQATTYESVKIGLVSVSDRASQGVYTDLGLPALKEWLSKAVMNPLEFVEHLIPDERVQVEQTLVELADTEQCTLIFTTGGTGPALRDITPDATLAIADREMPGFGEQMRQISLHYVPTAILSRQTAVIRGNALIVNLPGQPKSIAETLGGVRNADGQVIVHGLFSAIPYCIDILQGPRIEVNEAVTQAFRPKKK
ncbi:MAG: molybdopterin adenylyltransferase [Pelistega sp.]|nr:molybdopterin adenylyltransferase [Pelistega sp.]